MWNWQQRQWPQFEYDAERLRDREERFLLDAGRLLGAFSHVSDEDRQELTIEIIGDEGLKSSAIEGEILDRDSLQSSLRRHFGLPTDARRVPPAEQGLAEMMMALYRDFDQPLIHETLCEWHAMLMRGRDDLHDVGRYRTGKEPMQVVSGSVYNPRVHFEAPPAARMRQEMDAFIRWFNSGASGGDASQSALVRSGIAHIWFVSIHPFEDGNGRIARALSQKALARSLGQPAMIALSQVIEKRKKEYYAALNRHNRTLNITSWLEDFADMSLAAVAWSQRLVEFVIGKARLYDRLRGKLNARQEKVLARMFREGPEGFRGGLSAENYIRIADTSRATATRDLQRLVELRALRKTGRLKGTRYWLNV